MSNRSLKRAAPRCLIVVMRWGIVNKGDFNKKVLKSRPGKKEFPGFLLKVLDMVCKVCDSSNR